MRDIFGIYRGLAILIALSALALIVARHLLFPFFKKIAQKSKNKFDDLLLKYRTVERAVHLVPAIIFYVLLPHVLPKESILFQLLFTFNNIYFIVISFLIFDSFLHACASHILSKSHKQGLPIQGVRQALFLVGLLFCTILVISQLTGKSPVILLSGLGALATVFMLIFRDSILGFTAGVQIASLDLVRTGDWIEIPKEGINGTVQSVTLTSIRIINWDNTISILPAYSLVSTPFKNWRLMEESGRRRIQRSLLIDARSLAPLSEEQIKHLNNNPLYRPVLENLASTFPKDEKPLNLTVFRLCVDAFLRTIPEIDTSRTLIVRELESKSYGIPLEIYLFTTTSKWIPYENFSSTLIDRLMARLPEFGLTLYQRP